MLVTVGATVLIHLTIFGFRKYLGVHPLQILSMSVYLSGYWIQSQWSKGEGGCHFSRKQHTKTKIMAKGLSESNWSGSCDHEDVLPLYQKASLVLKRDWRSTRWCNHSSHLSSREPKDLHDGRTEVGPQMNDYNEAHLTDDQHLVLEKSNTLLIAGVITHTSWWLIIWDSPTFFPNRRSRLDDIPNVL